MARNKQKSAKGGAPISSHPAFPAIVALWFAALFGIGSLVLPTALLESVITGIGLDTIIPAAAPPLGFTARSIFALLVAGLGLAAGLVLARKVAGAQTSSAGRSRDLQLKDADRHPDAPAKRPISARRELGSEGLGPVDDPWKFEDEWAGDDDEDDGYDYDDYDDRDDDEEDGENEGDDYADQRVEAAASHLPIAANIPGRRRALSVTDDSGYSDYLQTVPFPGQSYDEPLELDILEEDLREDEVVLEEFAEETEALRNEAQPAFDPAAEAASGVPSAAGAPVDAPTMASQPVGNDVPATDNEIATSLVQEEPMNQSSQTPMPSFAAPITGPATGPAEAVSDPSSTPGRNALSDLGMAELVERFATAMQAKAEREEATASAPVTMASAFDGANPFADRAADADLDALGVAPDKMLGGVSHLPFTSPLSSEPVAAQAERAAATEALDKDEEPAAAPMVFRRAGAFGDNGTPAQVEEGAPAAPSFGAPRSMPSALQPVDMFDDDEDDDDDGTAHAPLSIDFGRQRPFADPVAREETAETEPVAQEATADTSATAPFVQEASFAVPTQFAPPEPDAQALDDEEEGQDAYSSLLNMKTKLSGHDFVRVEEEDTEDHALPEPAVVFPGQNANQQAGAPDDGARMFDAPAPAPTGANPLPRSTMPPSPPSDPTETERALREALEKLQRMSGAA